MRLGGLPGANYARQGALVGNGQGLIAVLSGTGKELVGAGGAPLEAEVAQAMQFGVVGCHANHPCSIQGPCPSRSEERRVGKEWRSLESPSHKKQTEEIPE